MIEKINIGMLHYHWLRGGVYTVVNNNLKALIAYGSCRQLHIDLISRDATQATGQNLVAELNLWAKQHKNGNISIRQVELTALDYHNTPALDKRVFINKAQRLTDQILNSLNLTGSTAQSPYILNPHNANLGKHPGLALALKFLAERIEQNNLPIRILYQMHDFAEDHRPQCWSALRCCSGRDDQEFAVEIMYPTHPSIDWVCINSTDKKKLESIGLNPKHISILSNAVEIDTFTQPSLLQQTNDQLQKHNLKPVDFARDLRQRIAEFAQENGFVFDPNRKIILSPIKVIRRKNVIESILLLLRLNAQANCYQLLLTLNANSQQDLDYSQAIEEVVKDDHLPVVIGYGHQLAGPAAQIEAGQVKAYGLIDLMALSHAVITTSIQEGFGYVFHEPWLAHKAVLGRNIEMVTSDFIEQGMQLDHLYEYLLIPQCWLGNQWKAMIQTYRRKIARLRHEAGLDEIESDRLSLDIRQAKQYHLSDSQEPMVDFADCDQKVQLHVIKEVTKGNFDIYQVVAVNKSQQPQTHWYRPDDSDRIEKNRQVVMSRYGLKAQAKQLERLLEQGTEPVKSTCPPAVKVTNKPVFERSLAPENNRLLI